MINYLAEGLSALKIKLTDHVLQKEIEFIDEMLRWNKRINLTSITDRKEAIEKHLIDSLMLLKYLGDTEIVLDMGSGGGFPGIPLAIAEPKIKFVSIDSVGKKINFQKHIKRKMGLANLSIYHSRVEELTQQGFGETNYPLIMSRAFSSLQMTIDYALPLLTTGGRVLAMKGPEGESELENLGSLLKKHHFMEPEVSNYTLPYSQAERSIIVLTSNQPDKSDK
ncbi:16S rRNA m(7)G-527 methyltransferase [Desulfuromusa kysingii]|uniref:Ribosomal RNA small subunit methyltransferase G n=1 Tax=Desulfuromusa kysingii TaxID=37625 RepID=A0A1H4AK48_9BACT|nr:16S rRNA (guanine(527)-N(7))-methyltransferase RsmG [Desulfuromusa kysingii]SEA36309.1 16S rRNA m(7)G-527 methyltransferase [Desulfuromusa kysingii]